MNHRKEVGFVTTPPAVAEAMAAAIPEHLLLTGKILDIGVGEGELIYAVAKRALSLGADPKDLADRLFGVDIVPQFADHTQQRLRELLGFPITVIVEDVLK